MDRTFWPSIVILFAVFGFFEVTSADLWIQDQLYDFDQHRWLVDAHASLPRLLFYTGPKTLIWLIGLSCLTVSFIPEKTRISPPYNHLKRWDLWILAGTLALAPLTIATLKATTNVHTPSEVCRYDGYAPYIKVCQTYTKENRPIKRGRGFPAGHASGGFSLVALAGLATTKRGRIIGINIGIISGGCMGAYQMFKGAHYMSHTLISAIICWIIFLLLRRLRQSFLFKKRQPWKQTDPI